MTIPTREEFKDLLSGMTDLYDYDDAIAAYDAQAERIAGLETALRRQNTQGCDEEVLSPELPAEDELWTESGEWKKWNDAFEEFWKQ